MIGRPVYAASWPILTCMQEGGPVPRFTPSPGPCLTPFNFFPPLQVGEGDVARVVSRWTGIPITKLVASERGGGGRGERRGESE